MQPEPKNISPRPASLKSVARSVTSKLTDKPGRRQVLQGLSAIGGAVTGGAIAALVGPDLPADPSGISLTSPAKAQATPPSGAPEITWNLTSAWPRNAPGPGQTVRRIADGIAALSGGRFRINVLGVGEIVPAFEIFDAVAGGTVQSGYAASFFWQGRLPAAALYTACPFGLTPSEHLAWLYEGDGLALWRELYAPSGVIPFVAGNTGLQFGGWFKQEINSLADLKGLKMRVPGLAGQVYSALGVQTVTMPPHDIFLSLASGVLDATEYLGPWDDRALGLHKAASYYYSPGFHEPNGAGELLVNQDAWDALPTAYQQTFEQVAASEWSRAQAEALWQNTAALEALVADGVQLRTFPADMLTSAHEASHAVVQRLSESSEIAGRIISSYRAAQARLEPYRAPSLEAYLLASA